jgi:AcrR family transcriptional regulator
MRALIAPGLSRMLGEAKPLAMEDELKLAAEKRRTQTRPLSPRVGRVLEELEGLFFAEGFLHFTMDELARRVHCSKRTLYSIALSREELFTLVIRRFLTRVREEGDAAARNAPETISSVAGYLDAAVRATRTASPQFVRDLDRFEPGRRTLREHQRMRVEGLERLVEVGIGKGECARVHPKLVAEVLIHTVGRMSDPGFLAQCGLTMSEAYAELYYLVLNGLSPRERPVESPGGMRARRKPIRARRR